MKVASIKRLISNYRYHRESKFLDKYCRLDDNMDSEVLRQLYPTRKGIANYAKSKGVTVEIADAEKRLAKETFEFDVDERQMRRASEGNLSIIVTQEKPSKKEGFQILESLTGFVPKNTKAITIHKVPDYIVVHDPSEGLEQVRITSHEYEDNFLKTIYRTISSLTDKLSKKKS